MGSQKRKNTGMTKIVLLDGGMGQELIARSSKPPSPLWSASVMMDEPEIVEAVHRDYVNAGAKVVTLNTYSATPERLGRDGLGHMFEPLHAKAIEIANAARGDKDAIIAGCLPPLVASYRPDLIPSLEECIDIYRQIVAQQKDHVDVFICETLASVKEVQAATTATGETDKPVWVGMTVNDGEGTLLRSGETLADGIAAAKAGGAEAVLINCSWPESVTQGVPVLAASGMPFGAYANGFTSIDALAPGTTVSVLEARKDLTPDAYADLVMGWVESGAIIVGGCCEVGPAHIAKIAERLHDAGHDIVGRL